MNRADGDDITKGGADGFTQVSQEDDLWHVAEDVAGERHLIVNIYYLGQPGTADWLLVDAALPGRAEHIIRTAEKRFGTPPRAILLTHGHFDHVGSLEALLQHWPVKVYADTLEHPFLNGSTKYLPAEPRVGGGAMAWTAPLLPRDPINIREHLEPLPADRSIPGMPDWKWVPTPGHSPGHISLFRESDRVLVAGDAVTTTRQEALSGAFGQRVELGGPPAYFTPDWDSAQKSVVTLSKLQPRVVATGHGIPLLGVEVTQALNQLALTFNEIARPEHGRYV